MGFLKDFLPLLKKHRIYFAAKKQQERDVYSFQFSYDTSIDWKAGQHGIFTFPGHLKGRPFRGFSITSSPREMLIRIATRIRENPSSFKKRLMELEPGDHVNMRGPFGPFHIFDRTRPAVFIAGGIGITPFMGLIREFELDHHEAPPEIELIYAQSQEEYAFKDEIDHIASDGIHLHVDYAGGRDKLFADIHKTVKLYGNDADYFVSGEGPMIRSLKRRLKMEGVKRRNIRSDWFFGY